jgi:hypothetical protein
MIAFVPCDIYGHTDNQMMTNKLFCTFVDEQQIDEFVDDIKNHYTIAYNKIFVLYVKSNDEYVCTYNILDAQIDEIPYNTILVHRKKESNTLYTINALNEVIKRLNNGVVDPMFKIHWQHYKNTILLTQHDELKQLRTKIHKIFEF